MTWTRDVAACEMPEVDWEDPRESLVEPKGENATRIAQPKC